MLDAVNLTSHSPGPDRDTPKGRVSAFLRFFLPLMVLAGSWCLAVPIDGSPDEHRHLTYGYALATGQVTATSTVYQVPDRIGFNRSACYAFSPEDSAACDRYNAGTVGEQITTATSANNYPRFYYRVAGWPLALWPGDAGIYVARLTGSLLSCVLLSAGFVVARRLRSPWLAIGLLLGVTPMVLFLVGSFNPHGLEIAACSAFSVALLALLVNPQNAGVLAKVLVLAAIPPMALSRPNGFIWPIALGCLAFLAAQSVRHAISRLGKRFVWTLVAVTSVTSLAGIWWQVARGSRDTGSGTVGPSADTFDSPAGAFIQILTRAQTFPGDWIGTFGWLDTRVTSATLLIWFSTIGGLVLLSWALRPGRLLAVAGLSVLLGIVFTVLVDYYYRLTLGVTVAQGRYVLPFALMAVLLVSLNLSGVEIASQRVPGLVAVMWVLGSAMALFECIRRYTVGVSLRSPSGTWDPPLAAPAIFVMAGVAMICLAQFASRKTVPDE